MAMQKRNLIILGSTAVLTLASLSFAQERGWPGAGREGRGGFRSEQRDGRDDREAERRGITLGICVGQALAQESITLPVPQAGADNTLDSATQAALEAALETCRSELSGQPSASPSASPSSAPSATPSASPTDTADGS